MSDLHSWRPVSLREAFRVLLFGLSVSQSTGEDLLAQTYPIRLDRPGTMTAPCDVTYRATQKGEYRFLDTDKIVQDKIVQKIVQKVPEYYRRVHRVEFVIELSGELQPKKDDNQANGHEKSILIKRWSVNDELVSKGFDLELKGKTLVIRENDGKKEFRIDGMQVGGFDLQMLELLFSVDSIGELGTDRRFGTKKSQGIGDSWSIAPGNGFLGEVLPSDIASDGTKVDLEVKADAKLTKTLRIAGIDCLQLEIASQCTNCLSGELEGQPIVDSFLERKISGDLPVDSRLPWQKVAEVRRFTMTRRAKEGPLRGVRLRQNVVEEVQREVILSGKCRKDTP